MNCTMFIYANSVSATVFKNVKPSFWIPMPLLANLYTEVAEKYDFDLNSEPLKTT
jgi:hypothetical protein